MKACFGEDLPKGGHSTSRYMSPETIHSSRAHSFTCVSLLLSDPNPSSTASSAQRRYQEMVYHRNDGKVEEDNKRQGLSSANMKSPTQCANHELLE